MAERHIRELFAKAGRQFSTSHEFSQERALWEAEGISFYPNSRFGIGVFSYFMLADEIAVTTRRLRRDRPGSEDDGIEVRIVGTGSLFRLRHGVSGLGESGTCVRLLLRSGLGEVSPRSYLDGIREWL